MFWTVNFKLISVPAPANGFISKYEMIRWPGKEVPDVGGTAALNVPVSSKPLPFGWTTVESNETWRSYEKMPSPVKSLTVTGTTMLPGVEVTAGSDTFIVKTPARVSLI